MMMFPFRRPLAALCLALLPVGAAIAAEPAIFAQARSFVGAEPALLALRSLRYVGTLTMPDPADPKKEKRVKLDVVFEKPDRQLMRMTFDEGTETTGLEGYEAWQLVESSTLPSRRRLTLLPPARVRRLLAETWENLYFFRGLEQRGGRVEDQGTQTVDGVACRKFAFIHSPMVIFYRYFDAATGRLLLSETEDGRAIREEGEMVVEGLRFPRSITTVSKDAKGAVQNVRLTFDKITINETLPPRHFAVPAIPAP
jgi:hypothetical protein